MTSKYYYNDETEELVIVELDGKDITNVTRLYDPVTFEGNPEETEDAVESDEDSADLIADIRKDKGVKSVDLTKPKKVGSVRRCSKCGQPGHQARTCPNVEHSLPAPNTDRVREMVDEGSSDEEIYNEMHDLMTDTEFREAIESARND